MADGTGGGIARIGRNDDSIAKFLTRGAARFPRLSGFFLRGAEAKEIRLLHKHLAANFDLRREGRRQLARQGWDGQQIGGDIFTFRAITARCPFDENAVFIQQIDRKPVYLWLPHKSQRFIFSKPQEAADTLAEIAEFFGRKYIIQA